jgi:Alw26I/Eco31I/Esp3I family type II restriction endonuclease
MRRVDMPKQKRSWHPNFLKYMNFIVNHPNYTGMPYKYKKDGSIRWVVSGQSIIGRARARWWDQKREEYNIPREGPWKSKVARMVHPTGEKPCQICGRYMKLDYVYPTKNTILRLNSIAGITFRFRYEDFLTLEECYNKLCESLGEDKALDEFARIFNIPLQVVKTKESYLKFILEQRKQQLSPGAMSNPPDRFDGYHSYNICCRSSQDLGRRPENLSIYGEDRRAYAHWCEGDWKATAWLMKKIRGTGKCVLCGRMDKLTADHIGPISLGFSLRPKLRPVCKHCNSARNYRMSLSDIKTLIAEEEKGEQVISWHSKYIWDMLKNLVKKEEDAVKLSHLMRRNMHHVLMILSDIAAAGYKDFLRKNFLHPEYAYYHIHFEGFDPVTGEYKRMIKTPGKKSQYKRNAERYIRIAFESLEKYQEKENRRIKPLQSKDVERCIASAIESLKKGNEQNALTKIHEALKILANASLKEFTSNNPEFHGSKTTYKYRTLDIQNNWES